MECNGHAASVVTGGGMLILTRRVGETLMIGDQVTVTVLGVKGNQVRVGHWSTESPSSPTTAAH